MKEQDLPHAVRDEGRAKFGEYEVIMTELRRRKLLPIMNRGITLKKFFSRQYNACSNPKSAPGQMRAIQTPNKRCAAKYEILIFGKQGAEGVYIIR